MNLLTLLFFYSRKLYLLLSCSIKIFIHSFLNFTIMKKYLGNAFSLQMINTNEVVNIKITPIQRSDIFTSFAILEDGGLAFGDDMEKMQNYIREYVSTLHMGITSIVGHADTANVIGVKLNRENVTLNKGDILYVAQLIGGRLPEGSISLPEGFEIVYLKVEIV